MKQDIERISAGIGRLLDEVEATLKSATEVAGDKVDLADEKGRETLRRVCLHLRNARSEVIDRAHRIDHAVHANPWRALALTAVVSFLAGLMVRRR